MVEYVFLDRDGVINRKRPEGEFVTRPEDFELLPGAAVAIACLNRSGRKVIVVTNQRGVALGRMTRAGLEAIHELLRDELAREGAKLDAIYYCSHGYDECECRKPKTGMLEAAFAEFPGATRENSVLIGDSLSDIECGRQFGLATIFINGETETTGESTELIHKRKAGAAAARSLADEAAASLEDAVRRLLKLP